MKKTLHLLLIFCILPLVWSCEKEDLGESKEKFYEDYEAHERYLDLFVPSTWIYINDTDSIRMELGYSEDTIYSTSISIYEYDIRDKVAKRKNFEYYPNGYVYENKLRLSYPNENKEKNYLFNLNNNKLTLKNYGNNRDYIFYKEYKKSENVDRETLSGVWSVAMNKDSVVLTFENGIMKEYTYEKNTKEILKYTSHKYFLYRYIYTYQEKVRSINKIQLYDSNNNILEINRYELNGNKLTIDSNNNQITYTKVP